MTASSAPGSARVPELDEETRALVRRTVAAVLSAEPGPKAMRRLAEEGWADIVQADPEGAVGALFEEQGRSLAATGALDSVVLAVAGPAVGISPDDAAPAVVYPDPGKAARPTSRRQGGVVTVSGVRITPGGGRLLVPLDDGIALVEAGAVEHAPVAGIDGTAGWQRVQGTAPLIEGTRDAASAQVWSEAVRNARRALGHELVGLAAAQLDIATGHVRERIQYGRPIGANQAVKHRLAEVLVTLSAARAALHEAWCSDDPLTAAVARSLAGRAHADASRHSQQVCGAIGFSWEFPLHRYIRRGFLLDTLLGSWQSLRSEVGETLLARGEAPRLTDIA